MNGRGTPGGPAVHLVPEAAVRPCPLCAGERLRLAFRKEGFDFRLCRDCGLASVNPPPTRDSLRALYAEWAGEYTSPGRRDRADSSAYERLLDELERWRGRGRLLDVGANVGLFLAAAARRGWEVTGIEPSAGAAEVARAACASLGGRVLACGVEEADLPEAAFDVVTMQAVLEHLLDPLAALGRVARWLRPGGCLYVSVPNLGGISPRLLGPRYPYFHPTHIAYFTAATLRAALERAGLSAVRVRAGYTSLWLLAETVAASLARRKPDTQAAFAREASAVRRVRSRPLLAPVRLLGRGLVRSLAAVGWGDVLEAFAER